MTESRCAAFVFSFLLHGIIVAAVLIIPFFDAKKEGPMGINLNFVTLVGNDPAGTGARPKGPIKSGKKENTPRSRNRDMVRDNELITRREPGAKNEASHIDTGLHRARRAFGRFSRTPEYIFGIVRGSARQT